MSKVWSNPICLWLYRLHFSLASHAKVSFSSSFNISNIDLFVLEIKSVNIIYVFFFHQNGI